MCLACLPVCLIKTNNPPLRGLHEEGLPSGVLRVGPGQAGPQQAQRLVVHHLADREGKNVCVCV